MKKETRIIKPKRPKGEDGYEVLSNRIRKKDELLKSYSHSLQGLAS